MEMQGEETYSDYGEGEGESNEEEDDVSGQLYQVDSILQKTSRSKNTDFKLKNSQSGMEVQMMNSDIIRNPNEQNQNDARETLKTNSG